jgi:molybdopterin converting factor small subunit
MQIEIIAYGIAKDILKSRTLDMTVDDGISIAQLKDKLLEEFPEFQKVASLSFAVNEDYRDDTFILSSREKVVIIPPVSGG